MEWCVVGAVATLVAEVLEVVVVVQGLSLDDVSHQLVQTQHHFGLRRRQLVLVVCDCMPLCFVLVVVLPFV